MKNKRNAAKLKINTILGAGTVFQGDFTSEGSVRVDGTVEGSIKVKGALIVGAKGKITGDVEAGSAVVGGEILGNVNAPEKIELTSSARVIGDMVTAVIVIDEKAVFQGKCDMNQDVPEAQKKPSAKAVRFGKKSAKAAIAEALKEVEEEERLESMVAQKATEAALGQSAAEPKPEESTQEQ